MSRLRNFVTSKIFLAAIVAVIAVAGYVASLPKSDAIFFQGVCTYYSSANYKNAVGARGTGCCGAVINWGVVTAYKKCQNIYCTDQICPN